jgi:hypothetical protein
MPKIEDEENQKKPAPKKEAAKEAPKVEATGPKAEEQKSADSLAQVQDTTIPPAPSVNPQVTRDIQREEVAIAKSQAEFREALEANQRPIPTMEALQESYKAQVAAEPVETQPGADEAYVAKGEKQVTVRGIVNHSCIIGNKRIVIQKDKETKVGADAAAVLSNAGFVVKK